MTTREDIQKYIDATMDAEATGTDSNKAYDTQTKVADDANNNDAIKTGSGNDLIKAGAGNDHIRAGKGDDNVGGQEGHDVIKLGKGDDRAFGGEGDDHIAGGRGNDFMDGGEGDDVFGAVNGSNLVRTGSGNDTIVLTYKQDKMEARTGNEDGFADVDNADHFTTVTDFEIGADTLHLSGLKEGKAPSKLVFDVSKDGTMISDQDGNKIVYLRDVQVEDVDGFITNSMDFGKFDWKGNQLETLMKGAEAPGTIKDDGSAKLVDFKDKNADYGVFDFGELGKADEFKFFHGDDGHLSSEAKAVFSGSSISENDIDDLVLALTTGDGVDGLTMRNVTQDSFVLDVYSGAHGGVTDTIRFEGEVVEQALSDHFVF